MSKSKFNVINPEERAKLYTREGLRYFLLREGVAHNDGSKYLGIIRLISELTCLFFKKITVILN